MSAPSSRCGAVVSQSEKARNANSFFDRITALLDDESVETTNRDDVDPQLRGQMRLATDHLQQMIRFARQFHQYRFSDDPLRCEKAGEAAWMLVQLHNKLHRGEVGTEFLKMVTLFDRRAKLTPQPDFFGFHHKSWAGVVNKIMLQHYCPFDDAFEASASPDGDTEDEQGIEESESSLWTPEAFAELCQRFDEHPLEILSFNASSWPVQQEPGKQSTVESPPGPMADGGIDEGGQGEADVKQSKGKKADHTERRLARLESKIEKPPRSDQAFVQQRLKFCCPRRMKTHPDSWSKIYNDYNAKFTKDTTASPGSLRLTHDRHCPKCKKQGGQ